MTYGREDRSSMERGDQVTMTLDDSAVASHKGALRVSFWRWSRRYPRWPVLLAGSLLLSIVLSFTVSRMYLVALPLALTANFFYWRRVQEHFLYGDANPGVVVSTSPFLIAVRTDMTKGEGTYPVLRILRERPAAEWGTPPQVGTRLATVGLYLEGYDDHAPYWERFEPRPVEPIAASRAEAQRLLESFSPDRWEQLERALNEIAVPSAGLQRLELESSDWSALTRTHSSSLA